MSSGGILDADMATLGRWLREGLAWWADELRGMCPPGLLRHLRRHWPVVIWDGSAPVAEGGDELPRRAEVHLPAEMGLVRWSAMPAMARRDLEAAVTFEADRLMPLPAAEMVLALGAANEASGQVAVAGIERTRLAAVLAALAKAGVAPEALVMVAEGRQFDFLSPARAAGLVTKALSPATPWWALAGLLVLANGATLIWRDMDSVARLQAQLDARQPIAEAAQRAARRLQAGLVVARDQAARRRQHDPLRALAQVTAALPEQAWVQRWSWDGRMLRISGYVRGPLDVVKALRDSRRLGDVRNVSSEVQGEIPMGRPFDVKITLGEG